MLKPMKPKPTFPNNTILWIVVGVLVVSGVIALVSAFSGSADSGEDEVNAVYTNAAATLAVQQMTLRAATPSVTSTTFTQTPTATFTPLASPTLFATLSGAVVPPSNTGSGAVGCNNSILLSDVTFQDNTVVSPGQTMTKTWKLQNTGSCAWTPTYKVTFVSGNAMSGATTPIGITVQPGQSGDISVAMTAPNTAGDAKGTWILTNDSGQNFGTTFFILVKVGSASSSGTATATATATSAVVAPAAATNPDISLTCNLGGTGGTQFEYVGTLTWVDNSNNETGFNVYINGSLVATVAANITSYTLPGGVYSDPSSPIFAVEAVNNGVKAAQVTVQKPCP